MSWKDLDIKLKAELIKLGVLAGITDKNKIIQMYDLAIELPTLVRKFEDGGLIYDKASQYNQELKENTPIGGDRVILDYAVDDLFLTYGAKTLEDMYKVLQSLNNYLQKRKQSDLDEYLQSLEEELQNKNKSNAEKLNNPNLTLEGFEFNKGDYNIKNDLEKDLINALDTIKNNNDNIYNSIESNLTKENLDSDKRGPLYNYTKNRLKGIEMRPIKKELEVDTAEELDTEFLEEEKEPNIELQNTDNDTIVLALQTFNSLKTVLLNTRQTVFGVKDLQDVFTEGVENHLKNIESRKLELEKLAELKAKIQEQLRIEDIQRTVQDSLTQELKPNTIEALNNPVEVDKNTIQEIESTILTFTPRQDSVGNRIDTTFNNWMTEHPTLYALKSDIDLKSFESSIIDKTSGSNSRGYRKTTDSTYTDYGQPIELVPKMIMWHGTGSSESNYSLENLISRGLGQHTDKETGYHFLIDRDGTVYQTMPLDKSAFHAGPGEILGNYLPNSYSIGVELVTSNNERTGSLTEEQLKASAMLAALLNLKYGIPLELNTNHRIADSNWGNLYKSQFEKIDELSEKDKKRYDPITKKVYGKNSGKPDHRPELWENMWNNGFLKYAFDLLNPEIKEFRYKGINLHYNGGYLNNQLPVLFRLFKNGGYKNKPPFEEWYKTVPIDRNDTTYYNLRKAYEELPFDYLERWRTATPEQLNNELYHLPTVSPQSLEFLKSRNHPSIQYELDWYNSPEGKDFRDKHSLDTTGNYYRYIPKAVGGYVNKHDTGGWKEKLLSLGNYAKNYIKAKAGMIQPMFMNLNDYNVQLITKDNVSDNTLGILTNDFVEENDNNEQRLAIDFKNTTDTKLGDREIPLENISTYYGIEDGKLKVGPLEIFNDSTMVVPNRAKNVGKVKKVLYKPQEQTEDSLLPLYGITVDNDTVPFPIRMRGKMYLGDEQGNSSFVSGITDPKVFNDVNKFLELNPSYPAMVDNGRFSHFILGNDLNSYIGIENPDDMYMLGITPKRKGGYISNNPTLAFSHKFGKGGFSDGKPTLTQNDLDKKVSKTYFENFPNLLKVYGTPRYNGEEKEMIENGDITGALESRNLRGEEEAKEVKNLLNNLTLLDSMFYTPILQRVDNIFEKTYNPDEEVSTMHRVSEGKMLSRLKDALQYYPVEEFKKKHQYILNKLLEVSDEDIYKFMTTNWGMDTVLDIMNIKPKNLSLAELLIIATTIHGMKSSYAPFKHKHGGYIFPKGVFLHKFDDGGYSNTTVTPTIEDKPKVVQKGTVGWNPFNVFNRNYRGAPIYESENFGDSFRLARIDGVPIFIWDGKAYNTNLKPNPLVEAARAWDTQGDLRKIEFQKRIISDPEGTMEYFRKTFPKGEYKTMNSNWDKNIYIIDDMYKNGALGMPNNVIVKGARYDIGNLLWDYLNTTNLTYNQKLALMANSYKESMGWTTTEQNNGPAKGYYQMENELFKNYQNWLKQDKLKDNIINETKYIIDLFENHRDELITPISANLDIEDVINNYKDAEEAYANNHRSAYVHRGYYTEDALRDWDEGDLDAAVKAMEALFEKAGKPRLEDRQKIAWLLSEMYK